MTDKTPTVYANVVSVRTTSTELILDFGVVVDPPGNLEGPMNFTPSTRVILSVNAARRLSELLLGVAIEHEQSVASKPSIAEKG